MRHRRPGRKELKAIQDHFKHHGYTCGCCGENRWPGLDARWREAGTKEAPRNVLVCGYCFRKADQIEARQTFTGESVLV
jgi:hypothetical protein